MRVIGTAGHVDHGKSTLVTMLSGINPDRLAEEQTREMTIDLGFAWLALTNGETVGIVDVPGHRDFIENMLAGVGGIDAVLLVIAADEGIMPQTREHLDILDLLSIQNGLIVLTKTDLVDDPDWLELVEQDIHGILENTTLTSAEIVRVSARTGAGLPELIEKLTALLADMPPSADFRRPRLPIDRVFTISGFGTVVTGTLLGGTLCIGDEVEIQPTSLKGRIRGLQSYHQSVEIAYPGSRVAVNLSGIEKKAIERGHVLSHIGELQATTLVDVHFRHLSDEVRPLKHNAEVKFFVGAAESLAYVRLLADETLAPGTEGWLQIRLEKPLALEKGDRFILRYPSPGQTIGGGIVVNPHPSRRWRRFQPQIIEQLEIQMQGTPAERVAQAAVEPKKYQELQKLVGLTADELNSAIQIALEQRTLLALPDGAYISAVAWQQLLKHIHNELRTFHQAMPLRLGMSREELRGRLGLRRTLVDALIGVQEEVIAEGAIVRLANHQIRFSDAQQIPIRSLMGQMANAPYTPPSYSEAVQIVGEDVLRALIELGEIVQVQSDVIFSPQAYETLVTATLQMIDERGDVTAASLRDVFQTTRKYAIGLLEHLDSIGVTRRVGDTRVRGSRS